MTSDEKLDTLLGETRTIRTMLEPLLAQYETAHETPEPTRAAHQRGIRKTRQQSDRWMSMKEVAEHFCVSVATVSRGLGIFAGLRRVPITDKRIVYVRSDVERLSRDMERAAVSLEGK